MHDVVILLCRATEEEREAFRRILDTRACGDTSPDELLKGLRWLHRNLVEDLFRRAFSKHETYSDILRSVCSELGVRPRKDEEPRVLEEQICRAVMRTVWDRMTLDQRERIEREIAHVAAQHGKSAEWVKAVGATGTVAAAELSGFGVYMLATTSLAAISGMAGVTLPFAAYTTLTSAMGVVLGPVGWVGTGLFAVWKVTGPNYKKLIPAVIYLAMLRAKYFPREEPTRRPLSPLLIGVAVAGVLCAGLGVVSAAKSYWSGDPPPQVVAPQVASQATLLGPHPPAWDASVAQVPDASAPIGAPRSARTRRGTQRRAGAAAR